ncbi:hypothetical protein CE91St32_14320 [Gordonibacter pamelaeae]|nr:hypothetical protein [Gordonibacter urolithinfaciens]GKG90389.1 hypothetical protein CE91St32_14320 [Gordonibacter pamelaeae]
MYLVDVAELVHPHEQHELVLPTAHGSPQGAEELVAVAEPGDRVDVLHDAMVRDHAGEQVRLGALPLQHHAAAAAGDVVAMAVPRPVQKVVAELAPLEHGLDVGDVEGTVIGVDVLLPDGARSVQVLSRQAEPLDCVARPPGHVGLHVAQVEVLAVGRARESLEGPVVQPRLVEFHCRRPFALLSLSFDDTMPSV